MKRGIQTLFLSVSVILITMSFGSPSVGEAQSTQPSQEALLRMLSGHEYLPSAQDLEALGPGVPALLMQIVKDPDAMKYHRLRALSLLRHYPDRPDVHGFLTNLLAEPSLPSGFLRTTILTLGESAKGKAIGVLSPYLSSKDVHIRDAAAQALFATGEPSAAGLLTEAAGSEPESFLKKSMEKMSQELEGRSNTKNNGASSAKH